ncbi:MAG: EAL domain-containing protein [Calditerrivibrio sp.]|nr:EAL domain-containing protein [Calditerrivibrio sp.]
MKRQSNDKSYLIVFLIVYLGVTFLIVQYMFRAFKREMDSLIGASFEHVSLNYEIVRDKYDILIRAEMSKLLIDEVFVKILEKLNIKDENIVKENRRELLKKFYSVYNVYLSKGIVVFDVYNLQERLLSLKNPELSKMPITEQNFIYQAITKNDIVTGYEIIDGRIVYSYNYPLMVKGQVVGGIKIGFSLYSIQYYLNKSGTFNYLVVLNDKKLFKETLMTKISDNIDCYHEDESILFNEDMSKNIVKKILSRQVKADEINKKLREEGDFNLSYNYDGDSYLLIFKRIAKINHANLFIIGGKQESLIASVKQRYLMHTAVALVLNTLLFGLLWLFIWSKIKLLKSEKFLSLLVKFVKGGLVAIDSKGNIKFHNDAVFTIFKDEKDLLDFFRIHGDVDTKEVFYNGKNLIFYKDYLNLDEIFQGYLIFFVDITENVKLQESVKLAYEIFKNSLSGIMVTDTNGVILDVNEAFSKITGYEKEDVLGRKPSVLKSGFHDDDFYKNMWDSIQKYGKWEGEIWNKRKNNDIYPEYLTIFTIKDDFGVTKYYVSSFIDISDIKKYEEKLEYLAYYNEVTKLPNKKFFLIKLKDFIRDNSSSNIAVCYLDIDGFKKFLDKYGLEVSNNIINQISNRILPILKPKDIISHFDEDMFVFATILEKNENLDEYLERIQWAIFRPFTVDGETWNFTSSIGVTIYPEDKETPDELIRHAQQAMFNAKLKGRNKIAYYDIVQSKQIAIRKEKVAAIDRGLKNREFILYLQPKINVDLGSVVGAEVLVRWLHPEYGMIPPSEFIPYIYNSDIEIEFDKYIFEESINALEKLRTKGVDIKVSINISPKALLNEELLKFVRDIVSKRDQTVCRSIEIEIIESTSINNLEKAASILSEFKKMGFSTSVDDFGTGYASLDYIKSLPIDTVKIDRIFVIDLLKDPTDLNISEVVILLARAFNKEIVAEGVEDMMTAAALYKLGCNTFQGYFISKPLPLDEFIKKYDELNTINIKKSLESYFKNKEDIEIFALINAISEILELVEKIEVKDFDKNKYDKIFFNLMAWLNNKGNSYFMRKTDYAPIIEKINKVKNILEKINRKDYPKDMLSAYIEELKNIYMLIKVDYENLCV